MRYLLVILLATACCSASTPLTKPAVAFVPVGHVGAVILRLQQRGKVIAVRAGGIEPTYSLQTTTGETLISDMTLGQLALKQPEMFQRVQNMRSSVVWAGE